MGPDNRTTWGQRGSRAFTLVDVLVSLAVIAVLIGILLPTISKVRESARRVVCSSNLRQIGLGLHMYSEDAADLLPPSVYLPTSATSVMARASRVGEGASPELMDTVRTDSHAFHARPWGQWDGLGLLFKGEYLPAAKVFYCPSHRGTHGFDVYESAWREDDGEIISNYQFRGAGPQGNRRLYRIDANAALVTDMLRSLDDLNHAGGFNVLQAGLAVAWFDDVDDTITSILARTAGGGGANSTQVNDAWTQLDTVGGLGASSFSGSN